MNYSFSPVDGDIGSIAKEVTQEVCVIYNILGCLLWCNDIIHYNVCRSGNSCVLYAFALHYIINLFGVLMRVHVCFFWPLGCN